MAQPEPLPLIEEAALAVSGPAPGTAAAAQRAFGLVAKRVFDVVAATVLLVVLSPLLLLVALIVKFDSPGPLFFTQLRPGRGGQPFSILKFRTMHADAEAVLQSDEALMRRFLENDCKLPGDEDPRISRIGRLLRKSSLDELPQLINVLRGDMSIVGPRPIVGPERLYYGEHFDLLLSVRPGITGLWQVSGRSLVHYPERAWIDLQYVTRWSFLLDCRILLRTIPAVFRREGAF